MKRGFSLVEIITALGILALLMGGIAAVSLAYLGGQQARAAAETAALEITQAQVNAFSQSDDNSHGVAVFPERVVRFVGTSYAARDATQDVPTQFAASVSVSGITEFVFPPTSLAPITPGTLTISKTTTAFDITISSYGVMDISQRTIQP